MVDDIDLSILKILQSNSRTSNAEIARQLGMAPSGTLERIRKLEDRGVIASYGVRFDPRVLGLGLLAFISVRFDRSGWNESGGQALAAIPEIQEVHHVTGEDCLLVKIRAQDPEHLGRLLRDQIQVIDKVASTQTAIVLDTIKESSTLPLTLSEASN